MIVNQLRTYSEDCTESDLYINGLQYCYVLEDIGRPHGVKVPRETCIPEGHYKAVITRSNRKGRDNIRASSDDGDSSFCIVVCRGEVYV